MVGGNRRDSTKTGHGSGDGPIQGSRGGACTTWNGRRYFHGQIKPQDWTCSRCSFPSNWHDKQQCFACKLPKRESYPAGSRHAGQAGKAASASTSHTTARTMTATVTGDDDDGDVDAVPNLPITAKTYLAAAARPPQSATVVAKAAAAAAANTMTMTADGGAAAANAVVATARGGDEVTTAGATNVAASSVTMSDASTTDDSADPTDQLLSAEQERGLKQVAALPGMLGELARQALLDHAAAAARKRGEVQAGKSPTLDGCTLLQAEAKSAEHLAKLQRVRTDLTAKQAMRRKERATAQQANCANLTKQIERQRLLVKNAEEELAAYTAECAKDELQWGVADAEALAVHDASIAAAAQALQAANVMVAKAGVAANETLWSTEPEVGDPAVTEGTRGHGRAADDGGAHDADTHMNKDDDDEQTSIDVPVMIVKPFIEPPVLAVAAEDKARLLHVFTVLSQWRQQGVEFPLSLTALGITAAQLAAFVGQQAWTEFFVAEASPAIDAPLDRRLLGILDTAVVRALMQLQVDESARTAALQAASQTVTTAAEVYRVGLQKKAGLKFGPRTLVRGKTAGK